MSAVCLTTLLACSHPVPESAPSTLLAPGGWRSPASRDTTRQFRMVVRTPKDTAERDWARMSQSERRFADNGRDRLMQVQRADAIRLTDTLVMDARSLAPFSEALHVGARHIRLTYEGRKITRVEQVADSAPRTTVSQHPHIPFGFNQLDLLMRAVPLRLGFRAILPLYSEATDVLEMDTLEVVRGPSALDPDWTLRFADPAIVSTVKLDPRTREISSYETTARAGKGTSRRLSVP